MVSFIATPPLSRRYSKYDIVVRMVADVQKRVSNIMHWVLDEKSVTLKEHLRFTALFMKGWKFVYTQVTLWHTSFLINTCLEVWILS
jgi:hypothetical protein